MLVIRSALSKKTGAARPFLQTVKCGGSNDSKGSAGVGSGFPVIGKASFAVYYGEDLFEDEGDDEGADRIKNGLTHVFVGAFETVAWLVGAAIVGALVGTDLESSPWSWVVLIALPLIVAVALWLRRTRRQERVTFDRLQRS